MANTSRKRSSNRGGNTSRGRSSSSTRRNTYRKNKQKDMGVYYELSLVAFVIVMILLFLCNFGIIGSVGNALSAFMFGVFGFAAYFVPLVVLVGVIYRFFNEGNREATVKVIAGTLLFLVFNIVCDMFDGSTTSLSQYSIKSIYTYCRDFKVGGGVIAGSIDYFLNKYLDQAGTIMILIFLTITGILLFTGKSLIESLRDSKEAIEDYTDEGAERRLAYAEERRERRIEKELRREELRERKRLLREEMAKENDEPSHDDRQNPRRTKREDAELKKEERENEKILRRDRKVNGLAIDNPLAPVNPVSNSRDMHEISIDESSLAEGGDVEATTNVRPETPIGSAGPVERPESIRIHRATVDKTPSVQEESEVEDEIIPAPVDRRPVAKNVPVKSDINTAVACEINDNAEKKAPKIYKFPPINRLIKGKISQGESQDTLEDTAHKLEDTLRTFGVNVRVTDISQGPAVTRYELQPEQGVKVSRIVGLADDIKLNLAATDIRIEAPIPGKAAIGIEVPNKENSAVALRDIIDSQDFKNFNSNICFAVGKDIAGKNVVADIAKMPHMLIAGATGSGKSVCINTIIISILYKANPDDVKLIMVDPKVVELSVYNGIPHLLIPVVTDPKKAAGALHWGVSEMEDRYRKFADFNVRDLAGYNRKVEEEQEKGNTELKKLPQIVIIVDELADLMMVSPGEVEESICRLAQLARAAGIHLIIATQRPSVDVITGLIKANMPSRVAFAVSSGVDSRTILDMVGAEKLLGKGDMLFYPQGYSKPVRVQGAFVSDKEVSDVVDFLKNQQLGNTYDEEALSKIESGATSSGGGFGDGDSDRDEYFERAGRIVIDSGKASIGNLQRALRIGFNRAARIVDQLHEYGVVGPDEGTKPRQILMSMEQFDQLLEEIY